MAFGTLISRDGDHDLIQTLGAHTKPVLSVAFSSDGSLLASGSKDTNIILWNTTSWSEVRVIGGEHTDDVNGVAFSPDGSLLISGSSDGKLIVWWVEAE